MRSDVFETHRKSVVRAVRGTVLEIGSGSGLNFPYYENVTRLYALEPSKEMHALAKADGLPFPIDHIASGAESIPLPDASIDSVVSTWTFCTIPHPEKALKEIKRVLKPGGVFSFIEHGISPRPFVSKIQRLITPIFKKIAGGCHLDRDIEHIFLSAGLCIERLEKFPIQLKPLNFMYKGIARKLT